MKNFYNVSMGQLYVLWIFAALMAFWAMDAGDYSYSPIYPLIGFGIPALVVFYSIGVRNFKKKEGKMKKDSE